MCRIVFILSLLCLVALTTRAAPLLSNPVFQSVSTRNGLPQDTVNDIAIDNDGFVWIATEGGLARWDGYRVLEIPGPGNIFVNAAINKVQVIDDDHLWISTYSNGVFRYDLETGECSQVIREPYSDEPSWIQYANNFYEADDGWLYVGLDQQVIRVHPGTLEQQTLFVLPQETIDKANGVRYVIKLDEFGLVATSDGLFSFRLDNPEKPAQKVNYLGETVPNIDNLNVKFLLEDSQSRVWIGTVQGLFMSPKEPLLDYMKNGGPTPITQVLEKNNIWEMEQVARNRFWIGTNKGLVRLQQTDSGEWQSEHILEPNNGRAPLSDKKIYAIETDALGNLWLSSIYGGALYFGVKSASIETIQRSRFDDVANLSNEVVLSSFQSEDGGVWIGTENGLNRFDLTGNSIDSFLTSSTPGLAQGESIIENILPGPGDGLILQTYAGIRLFDVKTGKLQLPEVVNVEDQEKFHVWGGGTALDHKGRLYFSSDDFYRYDPHTREITALALNKDVFDPAFSSKFLGVSSYHDNNMFLAMLGGLWLFDVETMKHQLVYRFSESQRRSEASISAWVIDKQGTLWLSFPSYGIIGLDADTFEPRYVLNDKNLLSTNIVYSLQSDNEGDLWFSSHSGLHSYSPASETVTHFSYGRELSVSEFNEASETTLTDGRLVYGSTQGVVIFDPERLKQMNDANTILSKEMAITDVTLDSRALSLPKRNLSGRHFQLNYDDFGITVYFTPLLMGNNQHFYYEYKLYRNNEIVTQGVTGNSKITFGTLIPGDYRFVVAPEANSFPFNMLPGVITLDMPYAPLRSPLAYAVYTLIFVTLLAGYLYSRQRYIQRLKWANEQVTLFYDAFQHTRDWVIIFDKNKLPVAANPAFERIFGLTRTESLSRQLRRLYNHYPKLVNLLSGRLSEIKAGEFWKDEGEVVGSDGREYDVLIDITAIGDSEQIDHYLLVISDVSEEKNAERKLLKIANYDSLTGLVNRSLLLDRLEHAIATARAHSSRVAILFVDLDRFKGINDSLGHDFGDRLLRVVANRMKNLVPESSTVARLGGDEFVVLIEDVAHPNQMGHFSASLVQAVETPIALGSETLRVSCSIGVALYPEDGSDPSELIKHADVAMYAAKKDALNSFAYFTEDMNAQARHRLNIENRVKRVYTEGGFFNHYQPIVNAETGNVEGVELLLRCELDGDAIYPDLFIPILEQLKYIITVTRDALLRALQDLVSWYEDGFTGYVSINLSALHFHTEFNLDELQSLLRNNNLPNSAIRFEITEGVLMDDTENAYRQIRRFVDAGFVLALDDFGTGYSSLSYLKRYPLSVLKIDKSFVNDVAPGNANDALVVTTINLASSLNMDSIGEGVETAEQAQYLYSKGCYLHQGYYYSRPVPASKIPALFKKRWNQGRC